jgi:exopolysaccharide production protein ExoZ
MVEVASPASPSRGVLKNVQALRAVAAVMVVFVHLDQLGVAAGGRSGLFEAGNAGVDLFFVISGLIMVLTTWGRPIGPRRFFVNRLKRVVPLYWIVTLAVFAIAVVAPSLMQATRADPVELAKSLLFIPFAKANGLVQPVAFVGWTLN